MNEHEARRIAASVNMLRPDWPLSSILTILARPELASRPRRDVAVALTWIACEASTQTPARVTEAGPWWKATAVDGRSSAPTERFDRRRFCHVCGKPEAVCRDARDHDFLSVEQARSIRSVPPPPELRAALRTPPPDQLRAVLHGASTDEETP